MPRMARKRNLRQGLRVGDRYEGADEFIIGAPQPEHPDTLVSPGLGTKGARTRSHAHGERHGRLIVHLVIVALAVSAIAFASQYPRAGSAVEKPALPSFGYSGVAGSLRLGASDVYLRPGASTRTLQSVASITRQSDVASVRSAGGVAPTSTFSSGVSAAAASSGLQNGGVTGLADLVDPTQPFTLYVTQPGDSVSLIASRFGIQEGTILDNNLTVTNRNLITAGLELVIPRADGILHKVAFGESLSAIVGQYDNITIEAALNFRSNAIRDPDNLEPGSYVLLPGAALKPPPPPPQPPPSAAPPQQPGGGSPPVRDVAPPPPSGGRFSNPLAAYRGVSDPFGTYRGDGRIHTGIDLDLYGYWNSPIFSACDGTVVRTEWWTYSYGYHVVIDCGDGFTTLYAHLSQIDVTIGQPVSAGTHIGVSGLTGFTTGEHLHFEIRHHGAFVDPAAYIGF
jgi:murein DD-endopeptidase MepM/ murein hydrolase activator NlpD